MGDMGDKTSTWKKILSATNVSLRHLATCIMVFSGKVESRVVLFSDGMLHRFYGDQLVLKGQRIGDNEVLRGKEAGNFGKTSALYQPQGNIVTNLRASCTINNE